MRRNGTRFSAPLDTVQNFYSVHILDAVQKYVNGESDR